MIGPVIRAAREAAGLSQNALGRAIKVEGATVARWELGLRSPSLAMLQRVARALGGGFQIRGEACEWIGGGGQSFRMAGAP